jgi:hypothetical protein
MGYRIAPQPIARKAKPTKARDYLTFIHMLPCAVTGLHGVEAAHLSYAWPAFGHFGRGKSQKASDRWALPLCPEMHRQQHSMGEMAFWHQHRIDPHILALAIWGLWSELKDDALEPAVQVIAIHRWKGD